MHIMQAYGGRYGMKCLNVFCKNELPEYRIKKIGTHVSKKCFCVDCLRRHSPHLPFLYKCGREDCQNKISIEGRIPRKYCSVLCKNRVMCNVGIGKIKNCIRCHQEFKTRLGYPQKYCSVSCRLLSNRRNVA